MRASTTTCGHPFFHISRHPQIARYAAGTTTVLLTSAAGFQGALAQTAAAGEGGLSAASQEKEEIVVTGRRSVVNEKLGGSVQDAPQSINLVTAKTLQEEAVTNMQDALKNVPGITLNAGEGTARGDTVNLRGFPAFNDFFLDGIRDAGNYTRDTFNLETLEVLEGPSAILFGRGSTGGVINQVTKAASLNAIQSVTIQTGTNAEARFTGDYDMPIGPSAAIRVNGMFERSGVVDRDNVLNRRYGIAPTLSLGVGEQDSLDLSFLHQHENDRPDESIPFLHGAPSPVPRGADYGLNSDRFITSADVATLRVRHEIDDDFSVSNVFRSGLYTFQSQRSFPNFGSEVTGPFEPASQVLVGRDDPNSSGTQRNLTDQLDFHGHFETGVLTHDLTIGLEYGRETNDLTRFANPFNKNNNWIPEIPLVNPNQNGAVPGIEPATSAQHTAALEQGAYLTDTIHIGQYFDLIGGARFDRFHATFTQNSFATATAKAVNTNFGRTDNITSPRAALVYKPAPDLSFYFSYGTSFDPSAEALSLSAGTASLGPVKADSYEVGAKKEWLDGTLTTTAALFRTEVSNAQINDPERPGVVVLAGDQRVDGVELDVNGHITQDWEILGGVILLDPKTVGSLTPANVGKLLINSARAQANLWTEYYIDEHWEVGTGGNFLGHRYADLGNTANIPSYFLWNGMVTYKVNENYSFQMNIKNIMDRRYYDNAYFSSASENHITPGAGRTFTFTAHANF